MDESWIIEYETTADAADDNQALIEAVFAQLAATAPTGVDYASYRSTDGSVFVHVVTSTPGGDALTALPAFVEFQRELPSRLATGPGRRAFRRIGSFTGRGRPQPPG